METHINSRRSPPTPVLLVCCQVGNKMFFKPQTTFKYILVHHWALYSILHIVFVFWCMAWPWRWQDNFLVCWSIKHNQIPFNSSDWSVHHLLYLPQKAQDVLKSNSHEKATSQSRAAWTSSIHYNRILIWMGTNSNIESLIKGNVNSLPKLTSIDMLSNSPVLVSYSWIIYILQWNIHAECHDCRRENKAEDSLWQECKSIYISFLKDVRYSERL